MGVFAIATLMLAGACGGDDDKPKDPKEQFTFGEEAVDLSDANLFLEYEGTYNGHLYRDYYITDGDADGTGATYYFELELAVPEDESITSGDYPAFYNWSLPSADSKISYLYAEGGDDEEYVEFDLLEDSDGSEEVKISGGVNDGEAMTVKFTGTMSYYHYDTETLEWVTENVTAKIYFKGEVDDVRSAPTRVGKRTPGGKARLQ